MQQPAVVPWRTRIVRQGAADPRALTPHPNNPRTHPATQLAALEGVLDEIGWIQNVVVNVTTGRMIDGHARVEKAIQRAEPSVPVVYVELTEAEEALALATFDPLGSLAVVDQAKMSELLTRAHSDNQAVAALLAAIKPVEMPPNPWANRNDDADLSLLPVALTQPGDIWTLGAHRLMCGDTRKKSDVARLMAGVLADMVYTDPPYGVAYDGGTAKREGMAGDGNADLYAPACQMAAAFSTPAAALYLWHADRCAVEVLHAVLAAGYEVRAQIIWRKNQAQFGTGAQYKQQHEPCWYAFKRGQVVNWVGPANEVTVWEADRAAVNQYHPTQKPVPLVVRALGNHSAQTVLDLFGGSGSTLIGADQVGRTAYLMEIDGRYVDVICRRWAHVSGGDPVREDGVKFSELETK